MKSSTAPPSEAERAAQERVGAALERLKRLHPKKIDLSLGRVERLLATLGHPERRLPPVIHVAGTNGKGSTVAFLRSMLEAGGARVHVYTSPHLVRFNERIRLAGRLIEDGHLAALLDRIEQANGEEPITYFEVTTCAAFLAYAEAPADWLLLEVGMGGRLDATNVVERPAVSVITRISLDHTQYLGTTLPAIAREKGGIMKPGVPAVVAPQADVEVVDALTAQAAEVGARLLLAGRDWHVAETGDGFMVGDRRYPAPALPGRHQFANAATAIVTLEQLGVTPSAAIQRGLETVEWPARLQRLTRGPLRDAVPAGWELWLDGGHNDSAGDALGAWLADQPTRPLHLVVGMLETKDAVAFLRPLVRHAATVTTVAIPGEGISLSAEALAEAARLAGAGTARAAESLGVALAALPQADGPARVLICGSLYLAGHVLAENG